MATPFDTPKGQPYTNRSAADGGSTYADYQKRIAADPNYKATKGGDMVGWIVQNYGKEWLKSDGTAPDEAIWTYTGGQNGAPKIGSVTGINYLPWNDKHMQYDVNGEDYSRPQYANGPNGMPTGGYKGSQAELQADRDAHNYYRNGGQGMDPALLAKLQGVSYVGLPQKSYPLPGGGTVNRPTAPLSANTGGRGQSPPPGTPAQPGVPGGPVPAGPSPYVNLPAGQNSRFTAAQPQARAPWMTQMDNSQAMALQQAQALALRGTNG